MHLMVYFGARGSVIHMYIFFEMLYLYILYRPTIVICDLLSARYYIVGIWPVYGPHRTWDPCQPGTPYARHNMVSTKIGVAHVCANPHHPIKLLNFLVNRRFIQPVNHILCIEVEIKLIHITTSTVLTKCKVTTTFTIKLNVTHRCRHVLNSV